MSDTQPNYIVYAPGFDPDSGGAIFLHELAHALGALGQDVSLWPWTTQLPSTRNILRKPSLLWRNGSHAFRLNPELKTRIALPRDLKSNTIVIYPEVTLGNPLRAKNIVRWLLYTPGIKDPFEFTENEMFFRAGEMSDLPELTGGAPDLFVWRRNSAYRNENRPERQGACYILRKGHEKPRIPETKDAICIDGLPHEEVAQIFNQCETFYSYDEATMYSQFAAVCGCTSVVVPGFFDTRAEWVADHPMGAVGVAYGLDDIAHAQKTRHLVLEHLNALEKKGRDSVADFIALTQDRFGTQ